MVGPVIAETKMIISETDVKKIFEGYPKVIHISLNIVNHCGA
jgi:hypothetical protein